MKTILATIAIGLTTIISSMANPSWGFTLGNGAGFYWNGGGRGGGNYVPQCMPRETLVFGPQYYRVSGVPMATRVINYSDAPIAIDTRDQYGYRRSRVIPRSWD